MLNPEISIIVPVYNAEAYLPKCIDSILKQSFQDFEILLINDGSTDKSCEICDEYALKDKRIFVYQKNNGGVSSARNLGLSKAIGKWVYFVDSDDTLFDDCLETLLMHTSDDIDCSVGGYMDIYENKAVGVSTEIIKRWNYKTALLDFYKPVYFRFNGYLWNRLFRHSIIKENNIYFHENIYFKEDGLFIVEFICKSKKDLKTGEKFSRLFFTKVKIFCKNLWNLMLLAMNKLSHSLYHIQLRVTQSKALAKFIHSENFFLIPRSVSELP